MEAWRRGGGFPEEDVKPGAVYMDDDSRAERPGHACDERLPDEARVGRHVKVDDATAPERHGTQDTDCAADCDTRLQELRTLDVRRHVRD